MNELQKQKRGVVIGYECDLSQEQQIQQVAQQVLHDFGHVDILISEPSVSVAGRRVSSSHVIS